jgi:hypothetical protein
MKDSIPTGNEAPEKPKHIWRFGRSLGILGAAAAGAILGASGGLWAGTERGVVAGASVCGAVLGLLAILAWRHVRMTGVCILACSAVGAFMAFRMTGIGKSAATAAVASAPIGWLLSVLLRKILDWLSKTVWMRPD